MTFRFHHGILAYFLILVGVKNYQFISHLQRNNSEEVEKDHSSVVSSLDKHCCHHTQEREQQEPEFPFVELFQQEKFCPIYL